MRIFLRMVFTSQVPSNGMGWVAGTWSTVGRKAGICGIWGVWASTGAVKAANSAAAQMAGMRAIRGLRPGARPRRVCTITMVFLRFAGVIYVSSK
ncbi:MAG: hypothetical protein U5K38_13175 [Woeseiaceae bacterium]|nr:hypothetical protein [Woeseiaceae bacterium]